LKHAGAAALTRLEPVLAQVRLFPGLKKKKLGSFYLRGSAFLHFHEDPAGLFADVKLDGKTFTRFAVSTADERETLLGALTQYFAK
jgi:hypothetical protein